MLLLAFGTVVVLIAAGIAIVALARAQRKNQPTIPAGFAFSPPPAWAEQWVPSLSHSSVRSWVAPSFRSTILLMRSARRDNERVIAKPFETMSPITVCDGHPALYVHEALPGSKDVRDEIRSQWGTIALTAIYAYPAGSHPDPAAEASIRSSCPRRG